MGTVALWLLAFVAGVALIVWGAEAFAEHLGRASVRLGVSSFALALLLAGAEPEELATAVAAQHRASEPWIDEAAYWLLSACMVEELEHACATNAPR